MNEDEHKRMQGVVLPFAFEEADGEEEDAFCDDIDEVRSSEYQPSSPELHNHHLLRKQSTQALAESTTVREEEYGEEGRDTPTYYSLHHQVVSVMDGLNLDKTMADKWISN